MKFLLWLLGLFALALLALVYRLFRKRTRT